MGVKPILRNYGVGWTSLWQYSFRLTMFIASCIYSLLMDI